jgi:hypothetical protein
MTDKIQEIRNAKCNTPSSEPFRIYLIYELFIYLINVYLMTLAITQVI